MLATSVIALAVPAAAIGLVAPSVATAHGGAAHGGAAHQQADEDRLRREEIRTLGPQHAAEHAAQRQGLRRWARMSPAAKRREKAKARRAAMRAGGATASADQVGRWKTTMVGMPTWAINTVVLPTGKVAYWGRGAVGTMPNGGRDNAGIFYVWDPATGESVEHTPPEVFFDRDSDGIEDEYGPAPLFCSGQSLLASGELFIAGGNRFSPWTVRTVHDDGSETWNTEFAGWRGTYSFDPWTEQWQVQPEMEHGRWYPTQVELPDGRIAITSGYDEHGEGVDNDTMEIFTPHPDRGGRGTLETVPAGFHQTDGFYPHMQVVPGGNVLLAGPGQNDSSLLDPAKLGMAVEPGQTSGPARNGPAWRELGSSSRYRIGSSAALLPAGPGQGSSRLMLLGGYRGEDHDPATGLEHATDVVETIDVAEDQPGWKTGQPGDPPNLDQGRSNGNLVQLPTGGFAYFGGGAGFQRAARPESGQVGGPEGNNATAGKQELKSVALWDPGMTSWRIGPPSQKWRSYHSTAVLLPDGRVLSAGDDYWGLDDVPAMEYSEVQDHGEIYEPAYLFDGNARAPRPVVKGGPSAVRWGDTFGVQVAEVAGRPIERVTLVAPAAVTHAVDMNRKFAELKVVDRVPGKGVNLEAPAGADLAPPGWYMLFAIDAAGTPAVAHWVQIRDDAPNAPIVVPDPPEPPTPTTPTTPSTPTAPVDVVPGPPVVPPGPPVVPPGPPVVPPGPPTRPPGGGAPPPGPVVRDVGAPKVRVVVGRPSRRTQRLKLRVGADEPARLRLRIRVQQGRTVTRTLSLTKKRLSRTITVRLTSAQRQRLRQRKPLRLRIRTEGRDAARNVGRRTLDLSVRPGRAVRRR